ncbi:unnamed protein product [Prorocentrum cordatum]|uniref:Uncharacterized protein n=2 Tax=Prorocentrum cordatum TaxID=2364126 RepID=A0ABN9Y5C2_9DINO|nr:unnamed protein product [Polarella glacialis]
MSREEGSERSRRRWRRRMKGRGEACERPGRRGRPQSPSQLYFFDTSLPKITGISPKPTMGPMRMVTSAHQLQDDLDGVHRFGGVCGRGHRHHGRAGRRHRLARARPAEGPGHRRRRDEAGRRRRAASRAAAAQRTARVSTRERTAIVGGQVLPDGPLAGEF